MVAAAVLNNEDYNEQTIQDMYVKAFKDIIAPFADPSMVAQSALNAYKGKGATADEPVTDKIGRVLLKSFTPGTLDYINKRLLYEKMEKKFGEGEAKNQYGFGIAKGEVDNLAAFGLRRQTANLSEGFKFNTSKPLRDMQQSKRRFNNVIKDYTNTDPNAVVEAYKESQQNKYKHAQRLRTILRSYKRLGMDETDMYRSLTKDGILSDTSMDSLMMIDQNMFIPDELTEDNILLGEFETKSPIDYNKIMQIYSDMYGSEID